MNSINWIFILFSGEFEVPHCLKNSIGKSKFHKDLCTTFKLILMWFSSFRKINWNNLFISAHRIKFWKSLQFEKFFMFSRNKNFILVHLFNMEFFNKYFYFYQSFNISKCFSFYFVTLFSWNLTCHFSHFHHKNILDI